MGEHLNATLYRRALGAFGEGDLDTLKGLLAPDVAWHEAGNPTAIHGREAVLERVGGYSGDLDADVTIETVLADDERVVAVLDVEMSRGLEDVRYRVVEVANLEDGMIVERWAFMDAVPDDVAAFFGG